MKAKIPLTIESAKSAAAGDEVTVADVYRWVKERRETRFMLPARFHDVSFESFQVDPARPEQAQLRDEIGRFIKRPGRRFRRFRRGTEPEEGRGFFLVGPPGVGKTHLLASAYRAASEPKLYASFDELVAAAGPLGMPAVIELLSTPAVVCIDEVVLEDPGNIMMLVTLLQHMLTSGARIIATANMPPEEAGGKGGWMQSFERELGAIASVFDVRRIDGRDRREWQGAQPPEPNGPFTGDYLRVSWDELAILLARTHPMHDAGWLERLKRVEIQGRIEVPADKDQALRFVRFIDRVYDRNVGLSAGSSPAPEELVEPLIGDPRFVWHVARATSRLRALLR